MGSNTPGNQPAAVVPIHTEPPAAEPSGSDVTYGVGTPVPPFPLENSTETLVLGSSM